MFGVFIVPSFASRFCCFGFLLIRGHLGPFIGVLSEIWREVTQKVGFLSRRIANETKILFCPNLENLRCLCCLLFNPLSFSPLTNHVWRFLRRERGDDLFE